MSKSGFAPILLILLTLIILAIIFVSTKLILPNKQSYEYKEQTTKKAQEAIDKYQQKSQDIQQQEVR